MKSVYVDFDDVICETARYFSELLEKLFGRIVPYEKIEFFNLQKSFNLTEDEYKKMMEVAHTDEALLSYAETPGARETLQKWLSEGHNVQIVTGRPYSSKAASEKWLAQHGFENLKIIFVDKYSRAQSYYKSEADRALTADEFLALHFDFAIDDSPFSFDLLEKMPDCQVAVFDRPWNKKISQGEPRFVRCPDWSEIDRLFHEV